MLISPFFGAPGYIFTQFFEKRVHPFMEEDEYLHFGSATIKIGCLVGNGAFANVRICTVQSKTDKDVVLAMKCIPISNDRSMVENEIDIFSRCSSIPWVAKLKFALETPKVYYIACELCIGGDLFSRMEYGVTYRETMHYLVQVASCLHHIHRRDIIYHDLKPENICFDENNQVKLVDFGLATILDDSTYNPATKRREVITSGGTLDYSAPEIFLRVAHGVEVDWRSFGVLAYELLSGELPFYIEATVQEKCDYICSDVDFHRHELIAKGSLEESFVAMFLQKKNTAAMDMTAELVCKQSFVMQFLWNRDYISDFYCKLKNVRAIFAFLRKFDNYTKYIFY